MGGSGSPLSFTQAVENFERDLIIEALKQCEGLWLPRLDEPRALDERVAELYLGPTLTARLRARLENAA